MAPYLYQFLFFFIFLSQMVSFVLITCPCPLYSLGPIPPASMISLSNLVGWFRYWAFHISYQACSSSVNFSAIMNWGSSLISRNTSNLSRSCWSQLLLPGNPAVPDQEV